jgi:type II secretory pathway pseudopilin PulG
MREFLRATARIWRAIGWLMAASAVGVVWVWVCDPSGLAWGIMTIGVFQVTAVSLLWPEGALREPSWTRDRRLPAGRRGGMALASALVAIFIVAMCLTVLMQAFMQGSRARAIQERRLVALAACQGCIEVARARGYSALPAPGTHPFAVAGRPPMTGALQVAAGPVPKSKLLTATVAWPADEAAPAGQVVLSTIMSARGLGG